MRISGAVPRGADRQTQFTWYQRRRRGAAGRRLPRARARGRRATTYRHTGIHDPFSGFVGSPMGSLHIGRTAVVLGTARAPYHARRCMSVASSCGSRAERSWYSQGSAVKLKRQGRRVALQKSGAFTGGGCSHCTKCE